MDELREKIASRVRNFQWDSATDVSDAEEIADQILAIPEIVEALLMREGQLRVFDAHDGGAKVLGAIREVLDHKGSVEVAMERGQLALNDLLTRITAVANLGPSISTNRRDQV